MPSSRSIPARGRSSPIRIRRGSDQRTRSSIGFVKHGRRPFRAVERHAMRGKSPDDM